MGERANYVVRQDGGWRLYYSHWGATRVDLDLVAGPEAAVRFITAQRQVSETRDGWLDDTWCEAGVLVDPGERRLLLFSWHRPAGVAARRVYFDVLARTWPGWQVRWAYGGIAEIAKAAGADPPTDDEPGGFAPADDDCPELLVTLAAGNDVKAYGMWADRTAVSWYGPGLASILEEYPRITTLGELPRSGLHLDPEQRTAGLWTTSIVPGLLERWPDHWPGWQLDFWADDHERHREAAGAGVTWPAPDYDGALEHLSDRVTRGWQADPSKNAAELLRMIPGAKVGPHFLDHVLAQPTPDELDAVHTAIAAVRRAHRP